MDGKITISRMGMQKGTGGIEFTIEDGASGLIVAKFIMEQGEFAECITGLGMCGMTITLPPNQYIIDRMGKERETKRVRLDWDSYNGEPKVLEALIKPHLIDGWELFSDGTSSQQNQPGHEVVLRRFVSATITKE